MSKTSLLLDLPKYVDEVIDVLNVAFQGVKLYRQENPQVDMIGYILLGVVFVTISSIYRRHRKNKQRRKPS